MRNYLTKKKEELYKDGVIVTDLLINDVLETIYFNGYIKKEYYEKNYNNIHGLIKDFYLKDKSNLDLYDIAIKIVDNLDIKYKDVLI